MPASNVVIQNYIGEDDGKGNITYTAVETSFECTGLCPGGKQYFKTEITNNQNFSITTSAYLLNLSYSKALYGLLTTEATLPVSYSSDMADGAVETTVTENNKTIPIYQKDNLLLAPGLTIGSESTTAVFWSVAVSQKADNNCMGTWVRIDSMQMLGAD